MAVGIKISLPGSDAVYFGTKFQMNLVLHHAYEQGKSLPNDLAKLRPSLTRRPQW